MHLKAEKKEYKTIRLRHHMVALAPCAYYSIFSDNCQHSIYNILYYHQQWIYTCWSLHNDMALSYFVI